MPASLLALAASITILGTSDPEPAHAANPVYQTVLGPGRALSGIEVRLPGPILDDGMSAEEEKAALVAKIGSAARLDEILRDSISAPIETRLSDVRSSSEAVLRVVEIVFAVHADEGAIDPEEIGRKSGEKSAVEAGNMRFEGREIPPMALETRGIKPAIGTDGKLAERFVRIEARLLDRIEVGATDRVYATRSDRSLVVASETAGAFDDDREFPNRWAKVEGKAIGPARTYAGGIGYLKVSKLAMKPGVVLVEAHFAFAEPKGWFGGEPVLRSKIGLAAQDQVRALRRELAARKERPKGDP